MITWINTQVDDVPLPLAPLLLVHLQHPPHRQQHARVSWRPWGDVDEDESWPTSTSCLVLCKWGSNDPKTPGRVTWLPGSPPNLLCLLPRVPLHHRPHHCRHHHREISGWKNILFDIFRCVLITCPTIIAIYQIKHVSLPCHIQTNISTIISTTNITFLTTATTRHCAAQLNIASGPPVLGQLWQDMSALP